MIEQHHETRRLNAIDEQLAQEQRRRILAGWAENKAIMADRYRMQMACVAPRIEEQDDGE